MNLARGGGNHEYLDMVVNFVIYITISGTLYIFSVFPDIQSIIPSGSPTAHREQIVCNYNKQKQEHQKYLNV